MNETLWNSTEDGIGSIILGGVTFFVHFYAILISSAIYDYQDEKPYYEMNPIDIQVKDFLSSWICFLYYNGLLQFIALFTPSITFGIVYPISQLNVF